MTLSDQIDKQLAELNQALDALEASVRRVRRFLEARPSYVDDVADESLKRRSEPGSVAPLASDPQWQQVGDIERPHLTIQLKRWGEVYDGGQ